RYHQSHAAEWVVRLGDGSAESARRMQAALDRAWPYVEELFDADAIDAAAAASGLGPSRAELREVCEVEWQSVFDEAMLTRPPPGAFRSTGSRGQHSEHIGYLLAEMQILPR